MQASHRLADNIIVAGFGRDSSSQNVLTPARTAHATKPETSEFHRFMRCPFRYVPGQGCFVREGYCWTRFACCICRSWRAHGDLRWWSALYSRSSHFVTVSMVTLAANDATTILNSIMILLAGLYSGIKGILAVRNSENIGVSAPLAPVMPCYLVTYAQLCSTSFLTSMPIVLSWRGGHRFRSTKSNRTTESFFLLTVESLCLGML